MGSKNILYAVLILCLIQACLKPDIKIEPHGPESSIQVSQGDGISKHMQIWFDLENGVALSENSIDAWQLAFHKSGYVRINGGKGMRIATTQDVNIGDSTDTTGLVWRWEAASGNLDSLAVPVPTSYPSPIYVLKHGGKVDGSHKLVSKFRIMDKTDSNFTISTANIFGGSILTQQQLFSEKNENTYYDIEEGEVKEIEPNEVVWDIVFTRFTQFVEIDGLGALPYIVNGVLLNDKYAKAALVKDIPYEEIAIIDVGNYDFSSKRNLIGYDWKFFNFSKGLYEVKSQQSYLVQTKEGNYFKLRFIDYYNDQGESNAPRFEIELL